VPYWIMSIVTLTRATFFWITHTRTPIATKIAAVIPGVLLSVVFVLFEVFEPQLPVEFRSSTLRIAFTIFVAWDCIFLLLTRRLYGIH